MIRTVVTTVAVTLSAATLVVSLTFNALLGSLGYALVTTEALAGLTGARHVVERMKTRHAQKKQRLAKRFAKKSGKRLATVGLAAATIGTAAVVVAVASLEADDYCSQREELQADANVLFGTDEPFDYGVCLDAARDDYQRLAREALDAISSSATSALGRSRASGLDAWERVRALFLELHERAGDRLHSVWDALRRGIEEPAVPAPGPGRFAPYP